MSRVHQPPSVTRAPDGGFRLRDVALAAYGPTAVNATGHGAVMPVLALRARELGADVSTAALVVALLGVGMLVASLPAGALVARIGERRTLFLARPRRRGRDGGGRAQHVRGRARRGRGAERDDLDGLPARPAGLHDRRGPGHRTGPGRWPRWAVRTGSGSSSARCSGAGLIHLFDLRAVFVLAAGLSLTAGLMALLMPDLGSASRSEQRRGRAPAGVVGAGRAPAHPAHARGGRDRAGRVTLGPRRAAAALGRPRGDPGQHHVADLRGRGGDRHPVLLPRRLADGHPRPHRRRRPRRARRRRRQLPAAAGPRGARRRRWWPR